MKRQETGLLGEKLAADFLKKKGFHILETNYRFPGGEIDIVARQKDCLVFVEVRTKTNLNYGTPEESITPTKIKHLERGVYFYQQDHGNPEDSWRIDLVAIELDFNNKPRRIEHIENAFEV